MRGAPGPPKSPIPAREPLRYRRNDALVKERGFGARRQPGASFRWFAHNSIEMKVAGRSSTRSSPTPMPARGVPSSLNAPHEDLRRCRDSTHPNSRASAGWAPGTRHHHDATSRRAISSEARILCASGGLARRPARVAARYCDCRRPESRPLQPHILASKRGHDPWLARLVRVVDPHQQRPSPGTHDKRGSRHSKVNRD